MQSEAPFVEIAARERSRGAALDEVLLLLREAGATQITCCKVLVSVYGLSLGEAKKAVDRSAVWEDRRIANEIVRDAARRQLESE
jgi:ribosomal protein L7/L12